jgi:hypothetical protein
MRAEKVAGLLNAFVESRDLKNLTSAETDELGGIFDALLTARVETNGDAETLLAWQSDLLQALILAVERGRLSVEPLDVLRYCVELAESVIGYLSKGDPAALERPG